MRAWTCILAAGLGLAAAPGGRGASLPPRPNFLVVISDDHRWDCVGVAGNRGVVTPHLDRLAAEGVYFPQATVHVPQCSPSRATLLSGLPPHAHGHLSNQAPAPAALAPAETVPARLAAAGYRTALAGKWHLPQNPWDVGFTDVRTWLPGGGGPYRDPELAQGRSRETRRARGFTQALIADAAVAFLRDPETAAKPFFLWASFTAPHTPLAPNPESARRPYRDRPPASLRPPMLPEDVSLPARRGREYYEAITSLDEQVGRLLDALRETRLDRVTVVVFLGDNGWMLGSRGQEGKVVPYEESIRVPLIVRDPRGAAGHVSDAAVSSLDLPVSILDWAGASVPATWPGRSLRDLAAGRPPGPDFTAAVCEWADDRSERFGDQAYRLIRTPRHKLIRWKDVSRPDELYALESDPHERANMAGRFAFRRVEADLRERLAAWMTRTADPARDWPAGARRPLGGAP